MTSQHQVAAIFDMDYTLLSDSSARMFFRYLHRTGRLYNYFGAAIWRSSWGLVFLTNSACSIQPGCL
jgi:hypothetical protein